MGAGGIPSGGVAKVFGKPGDLPTQCDKPNSRWDLYDQDSKERIQSRWFNATGVVKRNRDFVHQDAHNNHEFPHDHIWDVIGKKILTDGRIKYIVYRHKDNIDPDFINYNSDEKGE